MSRIIGLQRLDDKIAMETSVNTKKGLIGEKQVLLMLEKQLPTNAHIIHDPVLLYLEADILVIEESLGFIFIEVKTWSEKFVKHFYPNGRVVVLSGEYNPLKQAENYRAELKNIVGSMTNNTKDIHKLITSVVIYNNYAEDDFLNRSEVKPWSENMRNDYFKKHYFYKNQSAGFYDWLLSSRKFPNENVSNRLTKDNLNEIIKILEHIEETNSAYQQEETSNPTRYVNTEKKEIQIGPLFIPLEIEVERIELTRKKNEEEKMNKNRKVLSITWIAYAMIVVYFYYVIKDNPQSEEYNYEDYYVDTQINIDDSQETVENEVNSSTSNALIQNTYNYYILADSQYDKLTENQLYGLSKKDLRLARNEIYARHGYIFKSLDLDNYFTSQAWYEKIEEYDGELTDIEEHNVRVIQSLE